MYASFQKGTSMKARNSAWGLFAVVCFGLGIISGCDTHHQSVSVAKPAVAAQPLFTPEAASLAQQKMCDEQARKRSHEDTHGTWDDYTSHYDPTVNVCYIRATIYVGGAVSHSVSDAFGGRLYAIWASSQDKKARELCEIYIPSKPVQKCNSIEDFNELTEKYFGVTQ
jgi:hypothetical protein